MDTIEIWKIPTVSINLLCGQILHSIDCQPVEGDDSKE